MIYGENKFILHRTPVDVLVQTIITMGNTLGMNVIAESVETQLQLDFLCQHGCKTHQGYLFGGPVFDNTHKKALAGEPASALQWATQD